MTLAGTVLPMVRTSRDLHYWRAANDYGSDLHEAVAVLERAAVERPEAEVFSVTQKVIASACKAIVRADDSSGIIGDSIRQLLGLHAQLAPAASPPAAKLVDWMINFQFGNECDFFEIDPGAYGPGLGPRGMARYRARLAEIEGGLDADLTPEDEQALFRQWPINEPARLRYGEQRHARFVLDWNARRLAVWDRDVPAIIATHVRDRKVAAWLHDTAAALAEIGETDLAIDWAKQATYFDHGHQSVKAARYWCELLAEHRPDEELPARLEVFRRWPTSSHAAALHRAAADTWASYTDEVVASLQRTPREAVVFVLHTLGDVPLAWHLAHTLDLDDRGLWEALAKAYETTDPLAVLSIYTELVEGELVQTDAKRYRSAARMLARMRRLAEGTSRAGEVDELIAELREQHRRRPRLQEEFDRAGLPR